MPHQHKCSQFEDSVIVPPILGVKKFHPVHETWNHCTQDANIAAAFAMALSSSSDVEAIRLSCSTKFSRIIPALVISCYNAQYLCICPNCSILFDQFPQGTVWLDPLGILQIFRWASLTVSTAKPASISISWQLGKLHPFQNLWSIAPTSFSQACTEAFNIIQ